MDNHQNPRFDVAMTISTRRDKSLNYTDLDESFTAPRQATTKISINNYWHGSGK